MTVAEFVCFYCGISLDGLNDETEEYSRFLVPLLSKQPSTKVEGFATIAETTSHQACLRPAPESPAGNPDPADFDLH